MADFKFNFEASDDDDDVVDVQQGGGNASSVGIVDAELSAVEVKWMLNDEQLPLQNLTKKQHIFGRLYTMVTVSTTAIEDYLLQKNNQNNQDSYKVVQAISEHSDLVAGQYEGGLKVWECSIDLCEYLVDCDLLVAGSKVLELGCGGGLPGMLAAKMGAASVHFQDFNREVIDMYTMVNIHLNNIDHSSCAFFAGDWDCFATLADSSNNRYDLILTSETIYNVQSYCKLLKVFTMLLTKTGNILVAAKSDYFGVGGGVTSFMKYVKDSGQFEVDIVKDIDAGVPRKILMLTRACSSSE